MSLVSINLERENQECQLGIRVGTGWNFQYGDQGGSKWEGDIWVQTWS